MQKIISNDKLFSENNKRRLKHNRRQKKKRDNKRNLDKVNLVNLH